MTDRLQKPEYKVFFAEIKKRIISARYDALKQVNQQLINLYWDIGQMIVVKQESAGWGKAVVEKLAQDLQNEFPGVSGFSGGNLWRMRNFYLQYRGNKKLAPLVQEISWSKNIVIFEKCKDNLEREYYIQMTKKMGWTKRVLIHHIENKSYEKFLTGQTNFDQTILEKYKAQATLAIKDEYTFNFLNLGKEHSESELEIQLVKNIRRFLTEMGGYFAFIGNQYRLELDGNEYFIDLLLYHRALKSLIAIELKIGEFKPEYAGKMQFYLSVLDDTVKFRDENPSIGIIICKDKKRLIVEYTLKDMTKPIGVATYTVSPDLPDDMSKYLPSPKEIAEYLAILNEEED